MTINKVLVRKRFALVQGDPAECRNEKLIVHTYVKARRVVIRRKGKGPRVKVTPQ